MTSFECETDFKLNIVIIDKLWEICGNHSGCLKSNLRDRLVDSCKNTNYYNYKMCDLIAIQMS